MYQRGSAAMWMEWSGCTEWCLHHIDRCQDDGAPQLYKRKEWSLRVESLLVLFFHHSTGLALDQRTCLPRQWWGWQLGRGIWWWHQSNQNQIITITWSFAKTRFNLKCVYLWNLANCCVVIICTHYTTSNNTYMYLVLSPEHKIINRFIYLLWW